MRWVGKAKPEFLIAARTRCRASCTAASPSPTTSNFGSPCEMSASTSTSALSTPIVVPVSTLASMATALYRSSVRYGEMSETGLLVQVVDFREEAPRRSMERVLQRHDASVHGV